MSTNSLEECLHSTIDITVIRTPDGPGAFGFGLSMNQDNTITCIYKNGSVYKSEMGEKIKVGMRVTFVNNKKVDDKANVTFMVNNCININKITLSIDKHIHPIFENYYNFF